MPRARKAVAAVDLDPIPTRDEAEAAAADHAAQERDGAKVPRVHRLAEDYVHTVHPDTGLAVVFVPGEALPEWAP